MDPSTLWDSQVFAALIGAGITGLIAWAMGRKTSRLACTVDDKIAIWEVLSELTGDRFDARLSIGGEAVERPFLFSLEVFNSGNQVLQQLPVQIRFDETTTVQGVGLESDPAVIEEEIEIKDRHSLASNEVRLLIPLLNPHDWVNIDILTTGNSSDQIDIYVRSPGIDFRLVDRPRVEQMVESVWLAHPLGRLLYTFFIPDDGLVVARRRKVRARERVGKSNDE